MENNLLEVRETGVRDILRYFDRIHDKLITLNSVIIAGYFALSEFVNSCWIYGIISPFLSLILVLYIEYLMMEKSRIESEITDINAPQPTHGKYVDRATIISLFVIIITIISLIVFGTALFFTYLSK